MIATRPDQNSTKDSLNARLALSTNQENVEILITLFATESVRCTNTYKQHGGLATLRVCEDAVVKVRGGKEEKEEIVV